MIIDFHKYQGAGNDFVLLDNRNKSIVITNAQIATICDRKFGIGADGLILLEDATDVDFNMIYFNADGNEGSMCGNGGRCIAAFAYKLGVAPKQMTFNAIDGKHAAMINDDGTVSLSMKNVDTVKKLDDHYELDTGSPHYVLFVTDVEAVDIVRAGKRIRNYSQYAPKGINVNFVQRNENSLVIRTYERGVEDETLACGTGVTAAAIASVADKDDNTFCIQVQAKGGALSVTFNKHADGSITDVILTGPAMPVFKGNYTL